MRTLLAILLMLGTSVVRAADPNYQIVKEIPIGGEGGQDI